MSLASDAYTAFSASSPNATVLRTSASGSNQYKQLRYDTIHISPMPITRSELRKQYERNHQTATDNLVKRMFQTICDDVTTYNNYGLTKYCMELKYRSAHWTQPLVDRVVDMLKAHYIDSHIYTFDKAITLEWTFQEHFADKSDVVTDSSTNSEPVVDIKTSSVDGNEKNGNIQINISTRSSSRK